MSLVQVWEATNEAASSSLTWHIVLFPNTIRNTTHKDKTQYLQIYVIEHTHTWIGYGRQ